MRSLSSGILVVCMALGGAPPVLRGADPAAGTGTAPVAVLFEPKGPYRIAADAAVAALRTAGRDCTLIELPGGDEESARAALAQLAASPPAAILATGSTATTRALDAVADVPVVFCMVPNALDAAFLADDAPQGARVHGVASDVDPAVQIDWISRTCPRVRRIGLLHSARTARTVAALQTAGRRQGLELLAIPAHRDEFPKAVEALDRQSCDAVLMIPDAQVFNSPNMERILLWGVRNKKPVWAFSENVVKSGALSGLFCDGAEVGRQAAELVSAVVGREAPDQPRLQYPHIVRRAVNLHTARMIEVALPEETLKGGVVLFGEEP